MAQLLIEQEHASPVPRDLNWGLTRVGRGADNDVVLAHPAVSYHHCEFELGLDTLKVRDCGSTNGTFVEDRPIQETQLAPGQRVRIGPIHVRVEWSTEPVVVPKLEVQRPPESVSLGDGVMSCRNHRDVRSVWFCSKCRQYFCLRCIRGLNLVGRPVHKLCPLCSGHVELAPWAGAEPKKRSLWVRVKKAFHRTTRVITDR